MIESEESTYNSGLRLLISDQEQGGWIRKEEDGWLTDRQGLRGDESSDGPAAKTAKMDEVKGGARKSEEGTSLQWRLGPTQCMDSFKLSLMKNENTIFPAHQICSPLRSFQGEWTGLERQEPIRDPYKLLWSCCLCGIPEAWLQTLFSFWEKGEVFGVGRSFFLNFFLFGHTCSMLDLTSLTGDRNPCLPQLKVQSLNQWVLGKFQRPQTSSWL